MLCSCSFFKINKQNKRYFNIVVPLSPEIESNLKNLDFDQEKEVEEPSTHQAAEIYFEDTLVPDASTIFGYPQNEISILEKVQDFSTLLEQENELFEFENEIVHEKSLVEISSAKTTLSGEKDLKNSPSAILADNTTLSIESDRNIEINGIVYKIGKKLGQGANGWVYLVANDHGQKFALKILEYWNYNIVETYNMMLPLEYPGLMKIYDFEVKEFYEEEIIKERLCVITEYINGICLADFLDYLIDHEGLKVPQNVIQVITTQIRDTIEYLHSFEITHCDIKPDNTMILFDGTIKIIDLDSCQKLGINFEERRIRGTDYYNAIELQGTDTFANYNCTIDHYALGMTIFEMNQENHLSTSKQLCSNQSFERQIGFDDDFFRISDDGLETLIRLLKEAKDFRLL